MRHTMRLKSAPFEMIKSGTKKIELRLFDEKRATIQKGDTIEFENVTTGGTLICEVVNLYRYADFETLYAHHSKTDIGYREDELANPLDMLSYYSEEDIRRYGVVGIEIQVIL